MVRANKTTLCWVPSHQGILGNSIADKLAKDSLEYEISIELPIGTRNDEIDEIIKNWETKEANLILDKVDKGKTFGCFINSFDNKKDLRVVTGFMTGHCGLREHKIGKSDEKNCRLCNTDKENVLHFLTECNDELIVREEEVSCFQRP